MSQDDQEDLAAKWLDEIDGEGGDPLASADLTAGGDDAGAASGDDIMPMAAQWAEDLASERGRPWSCHLWKRGLRGWHKCRRRRVRRPGDLMPIFRDMTEMSRQSKTTS